ncbi:MAG TPA: beta-ketoacyl synthase chain length factor [Puia sp.]|nr:beta-ketoacyl synthase chain length factor [Puia sp.]
MMYIHQSSCISPQHSFGQADLQTLATSVQNKLHVIEPSYPKIPPGMLRRMGKAVRIGVGAALALLTEGNAWDGVMIGTANGGMEDCIKFLNQIVEYEEGLLAPGNFVQSTANAIASQVGLLTANKKYNATHVHRGLAFENALLDAAMFLAENPSKNYLVGGVDEISSFNYNIDFLAGFFRKTPLSNTDLFSTMEEGTLAGEGAIMFNISGRQSGASASIQAVKMIQSEDPAIGSELCQAIISDLSKKGTAIDLLLSGENGDSRLLKYYEACETLFPPSTTIARFKHMSGEFPTASAFAVWLATQMITSGSVPDHMLKKEGSKKILKNILIYNNHKSIQHSCILVSSAE